MLECRRSQASRPPSPPSRRQGPPTTGESESPSVTRQALVHLGALARPCPQPPGTPQPVSVLQSPRPPLGCAGSRLSSPACGPTRERSTRSVFSACSGSPALHTHSCVCIHGCALLGSVTDGRTHPAAPSPRGPLGVPLAAPPVQHVTSDSEPRRPPVRSPLQTAVTQGCGVSTTLRATLEVTLFSPSSPSETHPLAPRTSGPSLSVSESCLVAPTHRSSLSRPPTEAWGRLPGVRPPSWGLLRAFVHEALGEH